MQGQRVVVVGLGKSGVAAARFCAEQGAQVVGTDDQREPRGTEALAGLRLELGGVRAETCAAADLIVVSPGVPLTLPALRAARERAVPILGELELAVRFIEAPIIGITGTNGKSTVTSLCGAIAAATGRPSFCGGNLGDPLISAVGTAAARPGGIVVCEMSSFQLETTARLRCAAAAILNLTPDHLDRHGDLTGYGDQKARIAANMAEDAPLVLSGDDAQVQALVERNFPARWQRALLFTVRGPLPPGRRGGYVDGSDLVLRGVSGAGAEERYPSGELQIIGRHNLQNALAAFLLMRAADLASPEVVRAAARRFRPLPHRMELVVEAGGVRFYDDSKGTNVDAVVAGLDGFPMPFVLIAGGRHKGGSYAPLREVLGRAPLRGVVLIGEAAPLLEEALADLPRRPRRAGSLEEAVAAAAALCQPGDAVVLSPACSSYDMFRDYAHRAEVFRSAALRLPGAVARGGGAP